MNRTASVLALAVLVSLLLACGWLGRLKGNSNNGAANNRADNSPPTNSATPAPNANGADNSNRPPVASDFLTRFLVSRDPEGTKEATTFATDEKIYLLFEVKGMPAAKGLKGRLVADTVSGVRPGSSLDSVKLTRQGETIATYMYFTPPRTLWLPGEYHLEMVLINSDGTETVLRSKPISIHLVMSISG
jgi:hypothetical protein